MICPRCEKVNQEGATYCPYCGLSFSQTESAASIQGEERIKIASKPLEEHNSGKTQKQALSKETSKNLVSNYFKFLINSIKAPVEYTKNIGSEHFINGMMNLGLFSLFYGLTTMVLTRPLQVLGFSLTSVSSAFSFFILSFLSYLMVLMVLAGILYGSLKYVMKVNLGFQHVLAKLGTLYSVASAVMLVVFAFSILPFYELLSFLQSILIAIHILVTYVIIQSYYARAERRFDPILVTLSVWAITLLIMFVFLKKFIWFI